MSIERRLLLAFALSFLVIMLSKPLWEQRPATPPPKPTGAPVPAAPSGDQGGGRDLPKAVSALPEREQAASEPIKAASEREVEIETDLYRLVLSNKGALVRSWVLKRYTDSHGKPLDLVNSDKAGKLGYPLAVELVNGEEASRRLDQALFESDAAARIAVKESGQSIDFRYADEELGVQKQYRVKPASYAIEVSCSVEWNGRPADYYLVWRSGFGDPTVNERTIVQRGVYRGEEKITRIDSGKVEAQQQLSGAFDFAGLEDQYFAALFLPTNGEKLRKIHLSRDEFEVEGTKKHELTAGVFGGGQGESRFRLFVGPKDTEVLRRVGGHLTEVIDYGWFAVVCKPLFIGLKAIYSFCRNYGLAIIILTILINLALFPLRYKSIISAQKMQKLAPQMKAIQERYKKLKPTDPKRQQMNAEVMSLYKEHGVNPLGGCLPLLLQMPFFIAFYNLLSVSIELRHAPFALWIKDLSAPDPTFVLPILMTVSMVVMQKMTPTPSADPVQAKMMLAMPLVFGFMLAFTSSGLVLYWLTSNLVGIGQQYLMNRFGPTARVRPAKSGKKK
ncbi:MAG: membrane protein insertase YidC [Acidobacteriota bacterium]